MPLAAERSQWTINELKAAVSKYETLLGYILQKNEEISITLCELAHLCPVPLTL